MGSKNRQRGIAKCPTGIKGLDDITEGGLPRDRISLLCGNAGCGKTIMAMEFIARGALEYGEPGVFMSFEETQDDLEKNFRSMGFDLKSLIAKKMLNVDYVYIERSEIEETGHYDLDGLFIRLEHAIKSIGAKRVVLDTLEVLFSGLKDAAILRAEVRRLFRWLKEKRVTAVVTGERGDQFLTRYGLEEYVADCVVLLDLRLHEQIATRRLRVVKYRGSSHTPDETPFLIDDRGISVLPLSSLTLNHEVDKKRISTGIPRLDRMLGGPGYFRTSSVLVSGSAGSGKSSLAASFAKSVCERGERCLYFAFEESPSQIIRNMASIGMNLAPLVNKNLLKFHATRPSRHGLEMHLVSMHQAVRDFKPRVVVIDPISNLIAAGTILETKSMLTRLIDFLKTSGITGLFTDLVHAGAPSESTNEEISSLIDTWIALRDTEVQGERNRTLHVIKSRGMKHSNQVREFLLTDRGIELLDVYLGAAGVLTGSARASQESRERAEELAARRMQQKRRREREEKRTDLEEQIRKLRREFEREESEESEISKQEAILVKNLASSRASMAELRYADDGEKAALANENRRGV